jgi:hypothetical protein
MNDIRRGIVYHRSPERDSAWFADAMAARLLPTDVIITTTDRNEIEGQLDDFDRKSQKGTIAGMGWEIAFQCDEIKSLTFPPEESIDTSDELRG